MAKKCVCIADQDHPYDPFVAGMLVYLCPKTDKSIMTYLNEYVNRILLMKWFFFY